MKFLASEMLREEPVARSQLVGEVVTMSSQLFHSSPAKCELHSRIIHDKRVVK